MKYSYIYIEGCRCYEIYLRIIVRRLFERCEKVAGLGRGMPFVVLRHVCAYDDYTPFHANRAY